MYVVVDERQIVTAGYVASFNREGVSSLGVFSEEFPDWLLSASSTDLDAVQGFLLGEFAERIPCAETIRRHSRAPIIALSETRSLEQTLELLSASIDDVVRKPVHVREILARSEAIWRRMNVTQAKEPTNRLKVYFDGRDRSPVDGYQDGRDPAGISTQDTELAARLEPVEAGRRLANYLRVMTMEAQTLARACGKAHLLHLEPEDLVALTIESAAMARVPLAGTNWIPGEGM